MVGVEAGGMKGLTGDPYTQFCPTSGPLPILGSPSGMPFSQLVVEQNVKYSSRPRDNDSFSQSLSHSWTLEFTVPSPGF